MKQIPNFPDYYVTECGQVWSHRCSRAKQLSAKPNQNGYPAVTIRNERGVFNKLVHRLVAETYIPNPYSLEFVCHCDDNPGNPHKDNLFWGSHKDNMLDMSVKQRVRNKRLSAAEIQRIRNSPMTVIELSLDLNLHPSTIRKYLK